MAGDWSDLTKRVARGIAEVKKTTGSELVAESGPVPLAGRIARLFGMQALAEDMHARR